MPAPRSIRPSITPRPVRRSAGLATAAVLTCTSLAFLGVAAPAIAEGPPDQAREGAPGPGDNATTSRNNP